MKKLTQKTFLILTALSLTVCLTACGCIWFFLPYADRNRAERELEEKQASWYGGFGPRKDRKAKHCFWILCVIQVRTCA